MLLKSIAFTNVQSLIFFSGHLSVPPQPPPRSGRLNMPMQQHFDVVSPPLSGRSTPKAHVPNVMARGQDSSAYMHKYHTVSYFKYFLIEHTCLRLI